MGFEAGQRVRLKAAIAARGQYGDRRGTLEGWLGDAILRVIRTDGAWVVWSAGFGSGRLPASWLEIAEDDRRRARGKDVLFWSLSPPGDAARAAEIDAMCAFQATTLDDTFVIPAPEDDVDTLDVYFAMGGT